MKRIAILSAAIGLMNSMSNSFHDVVSLERARPVSAKRHRIAPSSRPKRVSKYMPHQGAKERDRAARCYMQPFHGRMSDYSPNLRSASVMRQMSKSQYEAQYRKAA